MTLEPGGSGPAERRPCRGCSPPPPAAHEAAGGLLRAGPARGVEFLHDLSVAVLFASS